ncbi:FtsP/CotA-like multicopper oxidase with cupredoxin domain [Kribbella amoyensis]|uniref:FtsP/CotA-like multicopper oxidase with cupredoxin domain n=1 Tax=Kribbella amoyensis TaxID=996641 RepID=A0A561BTU6_9ACTN|nr:multicopper oxidase family protein [Kribbella amoyensis]TWD82307.1 FtsP/CotA-like multicopper oxidase with cupredoxin domain [Kribbella amoyensis]
MADDPGPESPSAAELAAGDRPRRKSRVRNRLVALGVTLAVLVPLAYLWATSLVPDEYSAAEMGYADHGGGPVSAPGGHHGGHHGARSVTELAGPANGVPDVTATLVARKQKVTLASGETVDGYTLNGTSPGPLIRADVGDLVQVTLVNESVADGATLHWHGIDVPNAEDGVAGVTQDAVPVGGKHVYRFVADEPGTYWYHSHQVSSEQVRNGLFGTIVIGGSPKDVVAAIHTYDGRRTLNGRTGSARQDVAAGTLLRVRVINTDNALVRVGLVGAPYRVVAVDGRELNGPTPVTDAFPLAAGARADFEVTVPAGGVRLEAGGVSLGLAPAGMDPPGDALPSGTVDLLSYGTPAPLGLDPKAADRSFEYRIGRRPGFLDGVPGLWWTINGHKFPDVPMFMVAEGDVVRMTISNTSGQAHPMHLHGHHAVVLSRNGTPSTGTPWWVDTLEVGDDETYEIAFLADNPGLWMDHCHNLPHASEGLMTHLMYEGTTTPFKIGGHAENEPE